MSSVCWKMTARCAASMQSSWETSHPAAAQFLGSAGGSLGFALLFASGTPCPGFGIDEIHTRADRLRLPKAENSFVGKCGIMDQMASTMGRAGMQVFIDCRT